MFLQTYPWNQHPGQETEPDFSPRMLFSAYFGWFQENSELNLGTTYSSCRCDCIPDRGSWREEGFLLAYGPKDTGHHIGEGMAAGAPSMAAEVNTAHISVIDRVVESPQWERVSL